LTPFGAEALTGVRVLKAAQTALSLASAGGSAIRIVHVEEDDATGARVSSRLTEQLQQALDNERLQLALQRITPQLQPSAADLPTHIEMMPSMQTDGGIRVSAKALRIAAEQSERSKDLDRWLIRRVMRWMVEHPEQLPTQGVCIIGLSMASLKDASLPGFISEELINTSAPPGRLCFEVMEEQELGGNPEVEELVYSLREYGCRFLYGDFGGESSSFSRVKTLKVDMVRIGRMQSRDIVSDRGDAALVKSVIEMAHFLGIPAIADNINSKPMLTKLRELGIEYAQGTATSPVELAI
jgi:EAL domain-containing protein (putative c-di-GMP-specific phosphodiesterase class I)